MTETGWWKVSECLKCPSLTTTERRLGSFPLPSNVAGTAAISGVWQEDGETINLNKSMTAVVLRNVQAAPRTPLPSMSVPRILTKQQAPGGGPRLRASVCVPALFSQLLSRTRNQQQHASRVVRALANIYQASCRVPYAPQVTSPPSFPPFSFHPPPLSFPT